MKNLINYNCKVCNNSQENRIHVSKEMMFGLRDEFEYLECSKCNCLQLVNIPEDYSKYYPKEYYSFQPIVTKTNLIEKYLKRQLSNYHLTNPNNLMGYLLAKIHKPIFFDWLIRSKVDYNSEILDVGCGNGDMLCVLSSHGFRRLTGLDPYIESDLDYDNGVKILHKHIFDIDMQYDLIMLNHSFEHMESPLLVLRQLYRNLKPQRYLLLRIPIFPSYAWEKYGVDWANLDAPRHLFLHSVKSIEFLAENSDFKVTDIIYDSNEFQFWGSEQYRKNVPLHDPRSYHISKKLSGFSKKNIHDFRLRAVELNKKNIGDTVCIYLYKQ